MWKYKRTVIFTLFYASLLYLFASSIYESKLTIYLTYHLNELFIILIAYFSVIAIEKRDQQLEIFRFTSKKAYFSYKIKNGIREISFLILCVMIVQGVVVYLLDGELPWMEYLQYSFYLWSVLIVLYCLILSNVTRKHALVKGYLLLLCFYVMYMDMKLFSNTLFWMMNILIPFFQPESVSSIQIILLYGFYLFLAYLNVDASWKDIEE